MLASDAFLTNTEVLGLGLGAEKPGSHFCLPVTSYVAYCPSCFPFLCHGNLLFEQRTCLMDWSRERKDVMGGGGAQRLVFSLQGLKSESSALSFRL